MTLLFELGRKTLLVRIKKYLLLAGALAIGLVCAIGVNKEKPKPQLDEVVEKQRVFVAAIDMDAGEQFDLTKLRIMEVAEDQLVDSEPILELQTINGQFAAKRLTVGDPITEQVVQETDQVAMETLKPGYSTVTVDSHLDPLLIGLMESGCSVDVAGIIPAEDDDTLGITRLASNCQVMGVQQSTAPETFQANLTLLVKSEVVEPILLAMKNGDLHLSLTGAADEGDFPSGMIHTLDTLKQSLVVEVDIQPTLPANHQGSPVIQQVTDNSASGVDENSEQLEALANQVAQQVSEQVTDQVAQQVSERVTDQVAQRIGDRMDEIVQKPVEVAPANAVSQMVTEENYREMEVITPDGVIRYVWKTRDSEPVIIADESQETKTSQTKNDESAKIALQK